MQITELNLMAASMDCREWYDIAEPILANLDMISIFYLRHSNVKHRPAEHRTSAWPATRR